MKTILAFILFLSCSQDVSKVYNWSGTELHVAYEGYEFRLVYSFDITYQVNKIAIYINRDFVKNIVWATGETWLLEWNSFSYNKVEMAVDIETEEVQETHWLRDSPETLQLRLE